MGLRHFTPNPSLHRYVQSFSILEEHQAVFNKRIILPDSSPQLLINFGAPFIWDVTNRSQVELPRAFLVWASTGPLRIRATGPCYFIGVNFYAWGLRFLVDERINLAAGPIIPLDHDWPDLFRLLEKTLRQRDDIEAFATLEHFISDLYNHTTIDITTVREAIELLYSTGGQFWVNELAERCYISVSQLERRLKYFTGLSPKSLARLIRFDTACSGLVDNSSNRLTDLAHNLGYIDQAHFNHDFKMFTGRTPREVRNYVRCLAEDAEFLQLS